MVPEGWGHHCRPETRPIQCDLRCRGPRGRPFADGTSRQNKPAEQVGLSVSGAPIRPRRIGDACRPSFERMLRSLKHLSASWNRLAEMKCSRFKALERILVAKVASLLRDLLARARRHGGSPSKRVRRQHCWDSSVEAVPLRQFRRWTRRLCLNPGRGAQGAAFRHPLPSAAIASRRVPSPCPRRASPCAC